MYLYDGLWEKEPNQQVIKGQSHLSVGASLV